MSTRNDTPSTALSRREMAPPVRFRHDIASIASSHYGEQAQTPEGSRIISRFSMAFATAARASKSPDAFYGANPASVAACAALSLDTGLLPGGAMPAVWLIPRGGELQWMPSHRGLIMLAQQAGYQVQALPVGPRDHIVLADGAITELQQDPDFWPSGLDDLRGVAVFVTELATRQPFASWWLPLAAIKQRAAVKGSGPVWRSWPVEMAMKVAIKYGFARGYVPIESVALDAALSADNAAERVEVEVVAAPTSAAAALAIEEPADLSPEEEAAAMALELGKDGLISLYRETFGAMPGANVDEMGMARALIAERPPESR